MVIWNGPSNLININSGGGSTLLKTADRKMAIRYIAPLTKTVTHISILPAVYGKSPEYTQSEALPSTWTIGIQADNAGVPSGTFLTTGTITGHKQTEWFTSDVTDYEITQGTTYWIVIEFASGTTPAVDNPATWMGIYASQCSEPYSDNIALPLNLSTSDKSVNDTTSTTTVRYFNGSTWAADPNNRNLACFVLSFSDSTYHGQPYRHNYVSIYGNYVFGQVIKNNGSTKFLNVLSMPWNTYHTSIASAGDVETKSDVGNIRINTGSGLEIQDKDGGNAGASIANTNLVAASSLTYAANSIVIEGRIKNTNTANSETVIDDCSATTGWAVVSGFTGTITEEDGKLKVEGTTDAAGKFRIRKTFSGGQLADKDFLKIQASSTIAGRLYCVITDGAGPEKDWYGTRFSFSESLQRFNLCLKSPAGSTGGMPDVVSGTISYATTNYISIGIYEGAAETSFTMYIDNVAVDVGLSAPVEIDVPYNLNTSGVVLQCYTGAAYETYATYNLNSGATEVSADSTKLKTLAGTKLDDIYGVGLGRTFYAKDDTGDTPTKAGDGSDITYTSNNSTVKKIAFSVRMPPSDADRTACNIVRFKITIPSVTTLLSSLLPVAPLLYELYDTDKNGELLASGTLIDPDDVYCSHSGVGPEDRRWYTVKLSSTITLANSKSCFLVLKSNDSQSDMHWGTDAGNYDTYDGGVPSGFAAILQSITYDSINSHSMRTSLAPPSMWTDAHSENTQKGRDFSFKLGYANDIIIPKKYLVEYIMKQTVGTTKNHPVHIFSSAGEEVSTATDSTFKVSINGDAATSETLTLSDYDNDMERFLLTVPSDLVEAANDTVEIKISCVEGVGSLIVEVCDELNNLSEAQVLAQVASALGTYTAPTKAELDAAFSEIKGVAWTDQTLASLESDIAGISIIGGTGAERVIPADKYAFNASAKTITLTSPYDTITVEQVLSIRNLTKNMLLYDCTMTNRSSISIDTGVITHTYSGTMEDTDKLMIIVNMA